MLFHRRVFEAMQIKAYVQEMDRFITTDHGERMAALTAIGKEPEVNIIPSCKDKSDTKSKAEHQEMYEILGIQWPWPGDVKQQLDGFQAFFGGCHGHRMLESLVFAHKAQAVDFTKEPKGMQFFDGNHSLALHFSYSLGDMQLKEDAAPWKSNFATMVRCRTG